ncbi:MAG: hypothetical protein NTW06_00920 [Candidatus Falkowbacteria bacterium]|nr:hypothetical protein [Candidatus Falkowbacteria bacterium]
MHEGEALSVQNDISYIAEGNHHWEMARTVNTDASGTLRNMVEERPDGTWNDTKHAEAAFAEIMKLDPQVLARSLNRLAYGGERMREDGSGRDFNISRLGLMLTKALSDSSNFVRNHKNRFNLNAAQNLADEDAIKLMIEVGVKPDSDFIEMVKTQGRAEGGAGERISPENYLKKVEKIADKLEIYEKKQERRDKGEEIKIKNK